MGVTIHWNCDKSFSKNEFAQTIREIKTMAQEIGFPYVESVEKGYMSETTTKHLDGTTSTDYWFVSNDSHSGYYPQMRMECIRTGKKEVERHSIIVHPEGTESFAFEFIIKDDELLLQYGFCKTQAFSNDNPFKNARSHLWVIATLMTIKQIKPELNISDESDFYEENKNLDEMKEQKIFDSFGENSSLIDRIQDELKELGYETEQGAELKTEILPHESIKSTGIIENNNYYKHTIYEQSKVLYQELLETKKQLIIKIDTPKEEQEHENNTTKEG